jgi:hypothetical protein
MLGLLTAATVFAFFDKPAWRYLLVSALVACIIAGDVPDHVLVKLRILIASLGSFFLRISTDEGGDHRTKKHNDILNSSGDGDSNGGSKSQFRN